MMNNIHEKMAAGLDLNLLKVFEVVYRERHLAQAAQILHVTPSAVSHALRRLREALGDDLFVRDGRRMRPTPYAQALAPDVSEWLNRLRTLLQQGRDFDPAQDRQRFTIGVREALEAMFGADLVQRLRSTAPQISLASVRFERDLLARDLAAGRLDMVVDVAQPVGRDVRHVSLWRDDFCVAMSPERAGRHELTLQRYLEAEHVVVSARAHGPAVEDFTLWEIGHHRKVRLRCQSYHMAWVSIAGSDWLLTLPRRVATALAAAVPLAVQALPFELPPMAVNAYWHASRDEDPALKWLREQLVALT